MIRSIMFIIIFLLGLIIGWVLGFLWDAIIIYAPGVQEKLNKPYREYERTGVVYELSIKRQWDRDKVV